MSSDTGKVKTVFIIILIHDLLIHCFDVYISNAKAVMCKTAGTLAGIKIVPPNHSKSHCIFTTIHLE